MSPPPETTFELTLPVLKQRGDPDPANDVKTLQFMLVVLAGRYSPSERALRPSDGVNGLFDNQTTTWVKQFQRNEELHVDGVVGKNTWRRLLELWVARFDQ